MANRREKARKAHLLHAHSLSRLIEFFHSFLRRRVQLDSTIVHMGLGISSLVSLVSTRVEKITRLRRLIL